MGLLVSNINYDRSPHRCRISSRLLSFSRTAESHLGFTFLRLRTRVRIPRVTPPLLRSTALIPLFCSTVCAGYATKLWSMFSDHIYKWRKPQIDQPTRFHNPISVIINVTPPAIDNWSSTLWNACACKSSSGFWPRQNVPCSPQQL